MFFVKKGAMFGLDARIALVIFSSLSIIGVAALTTVYEKIKVVRTVSLFDAADKALAAYIFDTGEDPKTDNVYTFYIKGDYLITDKGVPGWKGPYLEDVELDLSVDSFGLLIDLQTKTSMRFMLLPKDFTSASNVQAYPSAGDCSAGCDYWLKIHTGLTELEGNLSAGAYAKALDNYYDDGDGYNAGRIRYVNRDSGRHIIYKLMSAS